LVVEGLQRPLAPMNAATPWLSPFLPAWLTPTAKADASASASDNLAGRLAALEERISRLETGAPPGPGPGPGGTGTLDRLEQRLRDLEGRRPSD
jgi:hypothetical protein